MNKEEFDKIMQLLQNPTRRRILEVLSKEEHYPLQLSRAIDTSQQAVSKHLHTMEQQGIVISRISKSEKGGPPTKTYSLNREISIHIDIGHCLFHTEVEKLTGKRVEGYEDLEEDVKVLKKRDSLDEMRRLILNLNKEIDRLSNERLHLLKLKEKALKKAFNHVLKNFDDYMERNLLYCVLSTGETDPRKLAKELKMREDEVFKLINEIKRKADIW